MIETLGAPGSPSVLPSPVAPNLGHGRHMVVIFDNDTTPVDEVLNCLMRATGCDFEEAAIETWEAQEYGQAPVHFAGEAECRSIACEITQIGVKTEVRKEWDD